MNVNLGQTPLIEHLTQSETLDPTSQRSFVSGISTARIAFCVFLVFAGMICGLFSMPVISNKYGNTDTIGFGLLGLAGWMMATGVAYLFKRFATAVMIGAVAAPLPIVALFALFWLLLIAYAVSDVAV